MIHPAPKPKRKPKSHRRRKGRSKRSAKSGGHLFPKLVDETYRAWIRAQPCLLDILAQCYGPTQVCHVKSRGSGGKDHGNVVPMCWRHHDQQSTWGIKSFQQFWTIDLADDATRYYRIYQRDFLTPFEP